jgi:hypothetical protein
MIKELCLLILKPLYTPSSQNRRSVTLVESISASGFIIPPIILVQGTMHIVNWYEYLEDDTKLFTSETGYMNSELALEYLDRFIQFTGARPNVPPKILLMDRHGSYMDPRFRVKATDNNIHPFPFPGYLTHILQPLDVVVFQPYKH